MNELIKAVLFGLVCFGLGVFLADFVKSQLAKLLRKNA